MDDESGYLGVGVYSMCRRYVERTTGEEVAVKITPRGLRERIHGKFEPPTTVKEEEHDLLRMCKGHEHIVQLREVFQDRELTYMVTELLRGGELLRHIRREPKLNEAEAWRIFRQILQVC